ncbi:MAG: AraC family transcriptional regulator [Ktedonobacteraceae bacterium]|nr:AraC family transcriptional regulator [Ktedonobacteraceae bacterium]
MVTPYLFDPQRHNDTQFTFEIRRALWDMVLKTYGNPNGRVNIPYEARLTDSPFVAMIWHGRAENDATPQCPADVHWYLRFLRREGKMSLMTHGPTTKATAVSYNKDDEFLGVRFQPGLFMPHLPLNTFVNKAIDLSEVMGKTFWLQGSTWEVPTYENVDIFIDRLLHAGLLVYDPTITTALRGQFQEQTARSIQMHFLQATGLTKKVFQQIERARYTAALLEQGVPIIDGVFQAGYFDQSHLTRSLKRFFGQTPSQIVRLCQQK